MHEFFNKFLQNEASKPDSPLLAEGASPLLVDNGPLSGPLHIQTEAQAEAIAEQTIGNNVILSFIFIKYWYPKKG